MGTTCESEGTSGPELNYMDESPQTVIQRFQNAGQGHVFNFWDELNDSEQD